MFFSHVSLMQNDVDEFLCSVHKAKFLDSLNSSAEDCMEHQML